MEKGQWSIETTSGTSMNGAFLERAKITNLQISGETVSFIADNVMLAVEKSILKVHSILKNILGISDTDLQ